MTVIDLIEKKKNKLPLSEEEYAYFIENFNNGNITDYQASALLMAIRINGCSDEETYYLTKAMLNTTNIIQPVANNKLHLLIDKHSSGGVGDKVSLIICPILASLGYDLLKLSGRGLGFTGGTIDKLESIGVQLPFDINNYQSLLDKSHFCICLQSNDFVKIDKKLYHLRDVTGTVDSLPLIASSILFKKFCFKSDYIFLDIKVGDGAFCKNMKMANELTRIIKYLAQKFNKKVICFVTTMNTPLGKYIGNAIEVIESVNFLNGKFESIKLKKFIYKMLINILILTKVAANKLIAKEMIDNSIKTKNAYNYFLNFIKLANGQYQQIENNKYWSYNYSYDVIANKSGYINYISTKKIGMISLQLGAGRIKKEDNISFGAGIILNLENNDYCNIGDKIATLYSDKKIEQNIIDEFINNIEFKNKINKNNNPKIVKIIE